MKQPQDDESESNFSRSYKKSFYMIRAKGFTKPEKSKSVPGKDFDVNRKYHEQTDINFLPNLLLHN